MPTHREVYLARIAFAPDGNSVFATNGNNRVSMWDVSTQKEIKTFEIDDVWDFSISPDGKTIALAGGDGVYVCPVKAPNKK